MKNEEEIEPIGYIVTDHHGRALELTKEGRRKVLLCGVRVTLFPDRETGQRHITATKAWAKARNVPWVDQISGWKIKPLFAGGAK